MLLKSFDETLLSDTYFLKAGNIRSLCIVNIAVRAYIFIYYFSPQRYIAVNTVIEINKAIKMRINKLLMYSLYPLNSILQIYIPFPTLF